jgi:hypothetical protein
MKAQDPRSGGALRQRVATALEMPLDNVTRPAAMRHVVLTSKDRDIAHLQVQLEIAANTLGPDIGLSLRLDGQCDATSLEPLREQGRKQKLGYIADPVRISRRPVPRSRVVPHRSPSPRIATTRKLWRAPCAMAACRSCWCSRTRHACGPSLPT